MGPSNRIVTFQVVRHFPLNHDGRKSMSSMSLYFRGNNIQILTFTVPPTRLDKENREFTPSSRYMSTGRCQAGIRDRDRQCLQGNMNISKQIITGKKGKKTSPKCYIPNSFQQTSQFGVRKLFQSRPHQLWQISANTVTIYLFGLRFLRPPLIVF